MSHWGGESLGGFFISSFAALEASMSPFRWWPLAHSVPHPHHHTKCWLCPLLGVHHIGRNGCASEVLLMDLARGYLLDEFQRLPLPHDMLGWEVLVCDL